MPNNIDNKAIITCSNNAILEALYEAVMHERLLDFIKPEPDGFSASFKIEPTVYIIDEKMSFTQVEELKNQMLFGAIRAKESLTNDFCLFEKIFKTCKYWIEGESPGRKSYKRLSDHKLITPLEESEFSELITKEDRSEWEPWRQKNWGTKWDIYDARADILDTKLNIFFRTAWSPPIEALKYLAKMDGVNDVKLAFNSLESGIMGTWENGFLHEEDYNGFDPVSEKMRVKMYKELFSELGNL